MTTSPLDGPQRAYYVGWSPQDEAYLALCPQFPAHSALGSTQDEALESARGIVTDLVADQPQAGDAPQGSAPHTTTDARRLLAALQGMD